MLSDPSLARAFAALGAGARAVVVCRASPRQKSAVVKLMQRYLHADEAARQPGAAARGSIVWHPSRWPAALRRMHHRPSGRTLAIGDGANDVAMLQAADVGVGIAGKEGRQAVNNADFALSQFRFLTRLLLVHGTLSQYRLARLVKCALTLVACLQRISVCTIAIPRHDDTPPRCNVLARAPGTPSTRTSRSRVCSSTTSSTQASLARRAHARLVGNLLSLPLSSLLLLMARV